MLGIVWNKGIVIVVTIIVMVLAISHNVIEVNDIEKYKIPFFLLFFRPL